MSSGKKMYKYTVSYLHREYRSKNENFTKESHMDEAQTQKCWTKRASPRKQYIIGYHFLQPSKQAKLSSILFRHPHVYDIFFFKQRNNKDTFLD